MEAGCVLGWVGGAGGRGGTGVAVVGRASSWGGDVVGLVAAVGGGGRAAGVASEAGRVVGGQDAVLAVGAAGAASVERASFVA